VVLNLQPNHEIADVLNIHKTFKKKRFRRTKKQFKYENSDEINDDAENNFRIFYFNVIADRAILSFSERFNQFKISGFYTILVRSKK